MPKKHKWTKKEVDEILSHKIHTFPKPDPDSNRKRGPNPWGLPTFVNDWRIREKFLDTKDEIPSHSIIFDLFYGGTGGGKSIQAVGLGLGYAINYPGSVGLVGAKTFKDVRDIVVSEYKKLLTIREEWDHPLVVAHPSEDGHNTKLILKVPLADGSFAFSQIIFMHFKDWERVRGRTVDWVHFEEISQMDDGSIIDELPRRTRGNILPVRHMICTTNPPKDFTHFIYEKWPQLLTLKKDYEGPEVKNGRPCTCQFCQPCLNDGRGEWTWDQDNLCSNPNCIEVEQFGVRAARHGYTINGTKHYCAGQQYFWRVHVSSAKDNVFAKADYLQTLKASSDSKIFDLYAAGNVTELTEDYCYPRFDLHNINPTNIPLDYRRDIMWALDFNIRPQCSVLIQEEYYDLDGFATIKRIDVVDEIVIHNTKRPNPIRPGAGPEDVALEFIEKYPDYKEGTIWLWGDPNGWGNTQDPFQASGYQIIYDVLVKNGYKVKMAVTSAKGNNKSNVIDKVTNVNWMLKSDENHQLLYVNPQCKYLIASLQGIKWDENGRAVKNKKHFDKLSFKAATHDKVRVMSHSSDALDDYVARRFNVIKRDDVTFFQITGDISIYIRNGKVSKTEKPKALENLLADPKLKQPSLKDLLDQHIQDMGDGPNLTFYFR